MSIRWDSGSVAIMASAYSAASVADCRPDAATAIGTGRSGRSQRYASGTSKWLPENVSVSPLSSGRMICSASSNISCRCCTCGHPPTTCSLRFSPAPRPSVNRPSESTPMVLAFCATTAGWYRRIGQVTNDISSARLVAWATAPSTDQAYGE